MSAANALLHRPSLEADLREAYIRLIEERFALRLTDHQARGLDEAVMQALANSDYRSPRELYGAFVGGECRNLLVALVASVTIGETHFFRVRPQIEALRQVVLPELFGRRATERRLRLWSAGCSTGEEPYTLAILLREQLAAPDEWDIQLLGTDISLPALDAARRALYGEWSFRDTPDEVRQRYFRPEDKRWRLIEPVRRMVRFTYLNLAADPFPSLGPDGPSFDLVLCRNVTIYFSPEATRRLYRRFADALAPGGWLVLGPSDPIPEQPGSLEPVYLPGTVLWRRPIASRIPLPTARPTLAGQATRLSSIPRAGPGRPGAPRPASPPPPSPPSPVRPNDALPDLEQVRILAHGGDRTAAREQAERLTRTRPLVAEAHLLLGMLYLDEGALEPAVESLRRATFLDAHNALAHFSLGRVYLQIGDHARARAALIHARRILAVVPDDQGISGGDGLVAGELRHAVEAQLASLNRVSRRG